MSQPAERKSPDDIATARGLQSAVVRLRNRMQSQMARIRDFGDLAFADTLDSLAGEASKKIDSAIKRLETDDTEQIVRSELNLRIQIDTLGQIKAMLERAESEMRRTSHPTHDALVVATREAVRGVVMSAKLAGDDMRPSAFSSISEAAIAPAWDNVGASLKHFDDKLMAVVRTEMTSAVLVGRTRDELRRSFEQLNKSSDQLAGLQRPDRFHRNRARMQVRAELNRVYTQTMARGAKLAGFQLFQHFGPIDARNVLDIGSANSPGVILPQFAHDGSRDFIGRVLSDDQWSTINPTWQAYGIHRGERGGFQPVHPEWPGIRERWLASEKEFGFPHAVDL